MNQSLRTLVINSIVLFTSYLGNTQTFTLNDSRFNVGDMCKINNLRLGFDGDRLPDDSKLILDSIAIFLKSQPEIQVEFGSFNDLRGSTEGNLRISQNRAEWFVNYLISKGVNKEQLIGKGYGETEPIITEEEINKYRRTDKREYERLHSQNRRDVLKILKIGSGE
jgi:outer membrane protein OmpA-like peptidoglycan-associated protein